MRHVNQSGSLNQIMQSGLRRRDSRLGLDSENSILGDGDALLALAAGVAVNLCCQSSVREMGHTGYRALTLGQRC